MTNCEKVRKILDELQCGASSTHYHGITQGAETSKTARYPAPMAEAIFNAFVNDGLWTSECDRGETDGEDYMWTEDEEQSMTRILDVMDEEHDPRIQQSEDKTLARAVVTTILVNRLP